ncbi:MAG: hypothetical protein ACRD96_00040, partial [Bryobacteraceae bacterium]
MWIAALAFLAQTFTRHPIAGGVEPIRGAALEARSLVTWGDGVRWWDSGRIADGPPLGAAGCLLDGDVIAVEAAGRLVRIDRRGRRHT